mmetsp:Transcript_31315/g.89855  ORF Transcript_31315/g.89855 Transcript_31315/m.89855 type:complete len:203 (-) Transcript_31315:170-778(-)
MLGNEWIRVFERLMEAPPFVIRIRLPRKNARSQTILSKGSVTSPSISEEWNTALMIWRSLRSSSLPWNVQFWRLESLTRSSSTTRKLQQESSEPSSTQIFVAKTPSWTPSSLEREIWTSPAVTERAISQSTSLHRLITNCRAWEFSSWRPRRCRPSRCTRSRIMSERQSPSLAASRGSPGSLLVKASSNCLVSCILAWPGSR